MQRGFILYQYSLLSPAGAVRGALWHTPVRPCGNWRLSDGSKTLHSVLDTARGDQAPNRSRTRAPPGRIPRRRAPARSAGPSQGRRLMRSNSGSQMICLCRIGSERKYGRRSAARRRFSTVQQIVTFSYPSPQSDGIASAKRRMRLVTMKNERSDRERIIRHASGRQPSASSRKKSEEKQVYTGSSPTSKKEPSRFFRSGLSNSAVFTTQPASRPYCASGPVHIAMQAAFGILPAAVPRIPLHTLPLSPKRSRRRFPGSGAAVFCSEQFFQIVPYGEDERLGIDRALVLRLGKQEEVFCHHAVLNRVRMAAVSSLSANADSASDPVQLAALAQCARPREDAWPSSWWRSAVPCRCA